MKGLLQGDLKTCRLRDILIANEVTDVEIITPSPSVVDLVYDALRRQIATAALKPGPVKISDLATKFNVSAPPVREALRRLQAEGLVTFARNRSVLVKALSIDNLREIFEMRLLLEPLLLKRAIPKLQGNKEAWARLSVQLNKMDEADCSNNVWRDANSAFHLEMYSYAEAPYLRSVVSSLWTAVEPYLRIYVTERHALEVAQDEHKELLTLVLAGNVSDACALLHEHLAKTIIVVEQKLNSDDGGIPGNRSD